MVILIYMIANKSTRKSIVSILKIVFGKQLGSLLLLILAYNASLLLFKVLAYMENDVSERHNHVAPYIRDIYGFQCV